MTGGHGVQLHHTDHDDIRCEGLLSGEQDRHHFIGYCEDCNASILAASSLERVEDWYRIGLFDQIEYEAYTYVWATSAPRFGNYPGWGDTPWDANVIRVANKIKDRLAARRAAERR